MILKKIYLDGQIGHMIGGDSEIEKPKQVPKREEENIDGKDNEK